MIFWAILGIIHLAILSFQDIFKKQWVDDRHNWFMYGLTTYLFAIYEPKWWIVFIVFIITLSLGIVLFKLKAIGSADARTITWVFTGLSIINIWFLIYYCFIFTVLYLFMAISNQILYKVILKKDLKPFPAYPLFLVSFVLESFFWL